MLPAGRSPGIWADDVVTRTVAPAAAMNAEMRMGPPRGLIIGLARFADSWDSRLRRSSDSAALRPRKWRGRPAAPPPRSWTDMWPNKTVGEAARPSPYEARSAESYECVKPPSLTSTAKRGESDRRPQKYRLRPTVRESPSGLMLG